MSRRYDRAETDGGQQNFGARKESISRMFFLLYWLDSFLKLPLILENVDDKGFRKTYAGGRHSGTPMPDVLRPSIPSACARYVSQILLLLPLTLSILAYGRT